MLGSAKTMQDNGVTRRLARARSMDRAGSLGVLGVVVCGLVLVGCRPAPLAFPASLNSQRPDERVKAAKQAVDYPYTSPQERRAVMEMLVARLEDDDDAVRLFAILALERMEGSRLGYSYHDPLEKRMRSVQAWRRHLSQQESQASGNEQKPGTQQRAGSQAGGHLAGGRE